MSHDPHTGFIVAAFAITFVVIAGTILAISLDHARLTRRLARLQGQVPGSASGSAPGSEEDRG